MNKIRSTRFVLLLGLLAASSCLAAASPPLECSTLKGRQIFNGMAAVTDAAPLDLLPGGRYCIVRAKFADSGLKIEVRLPAASWNGRLVYQGGGGFNGAIREFSTAMAGRMSPSIIAEHYAVMVSNGGYDGPGFENPAEYFKAEFAYDAVKLVDFMFQSVHRALPAGREVARMFYGSAPKRSYFEGCSTGGHEAMMQAQRYPGDFDGIVARGPAANFVGLYTQFHRISRLARTPQGSLSPAKQTVLAKAVLARCDAADGLADGILSRPTACDFDPRTLRCPKGEDAGDTCLSDAQIATVLAVTTPYASKDNSVSHAGYNYGAEDTADGWRSYIWPSDRMKNDTTQGGFSDAFIRAFVTRDPAYDTRKWDPNDWLPVLHLINELFQAYDPDLSGLKARGAKLIIWNGETDTSTSSRDNSRYYDRVVQIMGQDAADQVVELFLAPGVGHCGGGVGPDRVDLLKAVSTWVEKGTPPSKQNLNHEKRDQEDRVIAARPMCKYPAYPRYKGGDVNAASSFVCTR